MEHLGREVRPRGVNTAATSRLLERQHERARGGGANIGSTMSVGQQRHPKEVQPETSGASLTELEPISAHVKPRLTRSIDPTSRVAPRSDSRCSPSTTRCSDHAPRSLPASSNTAATGYVATQRPRRRKLGARPRRCGQATVCPSPVAEEPPAASWSPTPGAPCACGGKPPRSDSHRRAVRLLVRGPRAIPKR